MARETRAEKTINRMKESKEGNEREIVRLKRENRNYREMLSGERAAQKEKVDKLRKEIGNWKDFYTQKDYKVRIGNKLIRSLVKGDMSVSQKKLWDQFNG